MSEPRLVLQVNGSSHSLAVSPRAPLLAVLRNDLGCNGPKYGCGLGECGACTVLVDGLAARACVMPVGAVLGREVTTLDGLAKNGVLHPVQRAFVAAQAAQCGYCLNGMLMATVALLAANPQPSDLQIRNALQHNLCRCGTHLEILAAVRLAGEMLAAETLAPESLAGPAPVDQALAAGQRADGAKARAP